MAQRHLPALLIIMDGCGLAPADGENAVAAAKTPFLDSLYEKYPHTTLGASGEDVGLPDGQMGNSEVGHLNIGAGRIVFQELSRINNAIKDGSIAKNEVFVKAMDDVKAEGKTLHLMGLMSPGGVHSHMNHVEALVKMAAQHGVKTVRVHAFMDGRDVDPQSGAGYMSEFCAFLAKISEEPKEGEERVLVASPKVATYDLQPEMSAPEVTEKLVAAINEGRADFYIVNFANCDMVGHTGVFDAAVKAVEAVDDALSKVVPAILAKGGFALITADHGNADHMFDVASDGSKHPFTAHTTNRVPFIIVDEKAKLTGIEDGRLSDIAPTMLTMAGIEPSAEMTGRVLATEA